jgi:hypothetical protein
MKRILTLLLALLMMCTCAAAEDYTNPQTIEGQYEPIDATADDYGIGDPFVMSVSVLLGAIDPPVCSI